MKLKLRRPSTNTHRIYEITPEPSEEELKVIKSDLSYRLSLAAGVGCEHKIANTIFMIRRTK
jgi:hypothetical protein